MPRHARVASCAAARAAVLLVLACGALACERDPQALGEARRRDQEPLIPTPEPPANADVPRLVVGEQASRALDRLATATCEHDARCGDVGKDREHASMEACVQKTKMAFVGDINSTDCVSIDQRELDECVRALHEEGCEDAVDAVSRRIACRTSDLCRATTLPNH